MKLKVLTFTIALALATNLSAQTFTTLHNFNGGDGVGSQAGLILSGNTLYGTSAGGGSGFGTIFKVNIDGSGFTIIYSFDALNAGTYPNASLILLSNMLYGTTKSGGSSGDGTVFKIRTDGLDFTVLYNFTTLDSSGINGDGANPQAGLILSDKTLFGTTEFGGSSGCGTIFKINIDGSNFIVLHNFTGLDGANPYAGLTSSGNTLYGTSWGSGSGDYNVGSVFQVNMDGSNFKNLHGFTFQTGTAGVWPYTGLVISGNMLYGTTSNGGSFGGGTVFKINIDDSSFTTLFDFSGGHAGNVLGGLILSGNILYGTTYRGGDGDSTNGAVFAVNTDGTDFTNLYNFTTTLNGLNDDGANPSGTLILSGNTLFGTTPSGGNSGDGTVFALSLTPSAPVITIQPQSQAAPSGSNVTFSVVASEYPPPNYQWQFNGNPIAGATNASLSLTNISSANVGNYSVTVSNSYGSVASATAALKLVTIDISIPCYLMTATPLPDRQSGKNNLVVVTHGLEPGENNALANLLVGDDVSWITNMCVAISNQLAIRGSNDWQVVPYAWVSQAGLPPWYSFTGNNIEGDVGSLQFAKLAEPALENAENIGTQIGRQIAAQGWSHVHLIAHSAGAGLIQAAADAIRANAPNTVIQTTFLDPFLGADYRGLSEYGANADWSDNYFDYDVTGSYTQGSLVHSYNVDVTWIDPAASLTAVYVPGNPENFNQLSPQIIGYDALSTHGWPHDFYQETVSGTEKNCAVGYGFALSMEDGGGNNLLNYPEGNSPQEPCGTTPFPQNPFVAYTGSQLQIGTLPNSMSSFGATLSGNSGLNLSSTSLQTTLLGKFKPMDANSSTTNSPAWFAVGLTITNFVNFVQFDSAFTDSNNAEGLLTVYWDTNQIGTVDERVASLGLQTYRFFLPNTVTNNVYVLGFRLDSFDNTSSSITVTNVATGFIGITTPLTLGLTLTNNTPILQLTGASNYNYLVQTSTNLVDWTPTALLVNSNGTVLFPDSSATNSGTRFYRAVMP